MTFYKLSPKQKAVFKWCYSDKYNSIICDGAVRSGKTICMITSFILWAMDNFDEALFGICGKTVASAERNIIIPLMSVVDITTNFKVKYTRSNHLLTVDNNKFYIFGGRDESSYALVQGVTLSGVLFDEVALQPESFVNQAIARTLSVKNKKLWFNCNPDNPHHWFYKEWVLKTDERRALHLHFLMSDNPTLDDEQLADAKRMYSGVFKKRYIDGLWVAAEGVIYTQFADNPEIYSIDKIPNDIMFCSIGLDFGGNGSAHAAVCTGFSIRLQNVVVLDEYYRKEIISPAQLEDDVCNFIIKCKNKYPNITDLYCDSAEQTLIKGIKTKITKRHIAINVHNARKGEIIDRIRFFNSIISQGRFFIMKHCIHLIDALSSAVWNMKKLDDIRLDDGNYNIDSLDALEYSAEKYMDDIIKIGVRSK